MKVKRSTLLRVTLLHGRFLRFLNCTRMVPNRAEHNNSFDQITAGSRMQQVITITLTEMIET